MEHKIFHSLLLSDYPIVSGGEFYIHFTKTSQKKWNEICSLFCCMDSRNFPHTLPKWRSNGHKSRWQHYAEEQVLSRHKCGFLLNLPVSCVILVKQTASLSRDLWAELSLRSSRLTDPVPLLPCLFLKFTF